MVPFFLIILPGKVICHDRQLTSYNQCILFYIRSLVNVLILWNTFLQDQIHRRYQLILIMNDLPHFNSLRYVRPGDGYQPGFTVFEKCDVNGTNTHPVFVYLKDKLLYPDDDDDDPHSLIQDPKFLTWSTISRTDISWNFEKFLVVPEGECFKRYSKKFETINMEPEIQRLSPTKT
uniref:glutathione peroxidase n=1 Tax=Salmo trutta TaxID=8032 RepID=A0A673YGG6_SALTR